MNANTDYLSTPPGAVLKAAREEKSLTLEQVADFLHLRPSVVQAMEEGRYDEFDSIVFLKGYFRSYCRLVGLHESRMAELLDTQLVERKHEQEEAEKAEAKAEAKVQRLKLYKVSAAAAFIVALVGSGVYFTLPEESDAVPDFDLNSSVAELSAEDKGIAEEKSGTVEKIETAEGSELSAVTEVADGDSKPDLVSPPTDGVQQALQSSDEENQAVSELELTSVQESEPAFNNNTELSSVSNPVVQEPSSDQIESENSGAETAGPMAVASGSLSIEFSGDCWVEVRNQSGRKLVAQLKRAGDRLDYTGSLPMTLVLGDGRVASLKYNDQIFSLNPYLRSNGVAQVTFN